MLQSVAIRHGSILIWVWAMALILPIAAEAVEGAVSSETQEMDPSQLARTVAEAYGVDNFYRVEAIRFIFNAKTPDFQVDRTWEWWPKKQLVVFQGEDGSGKAIKHRYSRSRMKEFSGRDTMVDRWFINDQYWLIFPFHLVWDEGIKLEQENSVTFPDGKTEGRRLTVRYPEGTGYTPGDMYKLYLSPENRLQWWSYHPGAQEEAARTTSWEKETDAGPIEISRYHRSPDDKLSIWFSDVAVLPTGEAEWVHVPDPLDTAAK